METIASWVAPIATTIAALMTASNLGSRITGWGFVVFTAGSVAWLALGLAHDDPSLLWQNVVLTLLNLFGIWRWLGREARIERGGEAAQAKSVAVDGPDLVPASTLTRAKLVGEGGADLGALVDAMLDRRTGEPAYLVVVEGGVAGVGEKLRRLDWRHAVICEDAVSTRLDAAGLARCPELAKDDWPGR